MARIEVNVGFLPLQRNVFLGALWFSPSVKNNNNTFHEYLDQQRTTFSEEFLRAPKWFEGNQVTFCFECSNSFIVGSSQLIQKYSAESSSTYLVFRPQ